MKMLLASNQELTKRVIESNRTLAQAVETLAKAKPEDTTAPEVAWASHPLHVPEEEEDAQYLLRSGQIDQAEYERMLEHVGLEPVIEFD